MSDIPVYDENDNALLDAVEKQEIERLDFLLKSGCNLYVHDAIGNTALHTAVIKGDLAIVKALLYHGADVNMEHYPSATNKKYLDRKYGLRPLHLACLKKNPSIAELLLERGAIVNAPLKSGFTALHQAVMHNNLALTTILSRYGANVNARELPIHMGWTPLHYAVEGSEQHQYASIVKLLCISVADVNAVDIQLNTPLNLAFHTHPKIDQRETLLTLIQYGADVNMRNDIGGNPLEICIGYFRYHRYIPMLIEAGAQLSAKTISKLLKVTPSEPAYMNCVYLLTQVQSLQNLCRIMIRRQIMLHNGNRTRSLPDCINKLLLPLRIKDYIKMVHLGECLE